MIHFHKWGMWQKIFGNTYGGTSVQERTCTTCGKTKKRFVR